ncbi:NAD(P)-binding protein [Lentithecium fluviatile CBS 122367]|uniref:NAD(P)-binding protein n=1 Tax=Lentithecium fluviatile CBS 122367 TaxID=1168545 RepID=A0A6G1J452_9PLEO|nr:NAD(P)-binding protein [Lentithecium fluviatile CBS 122367]
MVPLPQFDLTPEKEASVLQFFYRQFFVNTPALTQDNAKLKGKTAIVTGSNTGLGLEVSRQLLDLGLSKLILAVRNATKGKIAAKSLSSGRSPSSCEIEVWNLDLSAYESVVEFAERTKTLESLNIAVLNAGVFKANEAYNPSTRFEEDVQINYLSNILLASLLLPVMKTKSGAHPNRLVLVSSDTAGWAKFNERKSRPILDAFKQQNAQKWDMQERYGTSKLLGQLFLTELAEHVPASVVTVNAANPGFCYGSELGREGNGTILGFIVDIVTRLVGKPCHLGARSIIHAAVSFGEEVHGQYVEDGRIRPKAPLIYRSEGEKIMGDLWEETMTELSFAKVRESIQGLKE